MKRRAFMLLGAVILLCVLLGLGLWRQTAWGADEVTFRIGTFDREVDPLVNDEGRILLVRSDGSKLKIFELRRWPKKVALRTQLEAGGFIDRMSAATSPAGSPGSTLIIAKTCPGQEGVPDPEGGRRCPPGASQEHFAYELDSEARLLGRPLQLPSWLDVWVEPFAGGFVLLGLAGEPNPPVPHLTTAAFERAIYRGGQISRLQGVTLGGYPSCATHDALWALSGPTSPTDWARQDGAAGRDHTGYTLWRLSLGQSGIGRFIEVQMPALKTASRVVYLGCGDDEAYVFVLRPNAEGSLYSTKRPTTEMRPPVGTVWNLADHTGGLPTVRTKDTHGSPCGVITEDGRIVRKSVPRTKQSSCDAAVWRIDNRLVAITQRPQGADYPPVSRVTVGPW